MVLPGVNCFRLYVSRPIFFAVDGDPSNVLLSGVNKLSARGNRFTRETPQRMSSSVSIVIFTLICALGLSVTTSARPGDLDPTFGSGGIVVTGVPGLYYATAIAVQSDGKIVAVGEVDSVSAGDFAVVRYNTNGSLDTSFGFSGAVFTSIRSSYDGASSVAIQADGKIVVAGYSYDDIPGNSSFAVVRYNANGSLDTSFNGTGIVRTSVGGHSRSSAHSVAIQTDDKLIAAGGSWNGSNYDFALVRYNTNGSLDTSFGGTGKVIIPVGNSYDSANSVAIQADGRIVAAGVSYDDNPGNSSFAVVRYNINGSLDTSFNGTGIVTTAFTGEFAGGYDRANSVAIQTDGNIVAAGVSTNYPNPNPTFEFALVRYNSDGSLDTSFSGGIVIMPVGNSSDLANSVAIQPDGKIVAAGKSWINTDYEFALVRLNSNGSLDTTFNGTGKVVTVTPGNSAGSVAIQADGKIVAAGGQDDWNFGFMLVRYQGGSNANIRAHFDYDGDGRTDASVFRPSTNEWHIAQSSGGIRVQGWGVSGDRMAPADFDGDGKTDISVFRPNEGNWYVINSSDNTVTVAGWGNSTDQLVPGDYNGDGKADFVVYRPSEGRWYRRDTDGQVHVQDWGLVGDKPAPADFDGDGRLDLTVFRPSEGRWYTIRSSDFVITATDWGVSGDVPVAADYSGDSKADFVVFRPSDLTWYRRHTDNNSFHFITWGLAGDLPTPGDYDGDGKNDLAVFRPSNSTWFIFASQAGIYSQPFGLSGDVPTPNAFVY